MKAVTFYFRNLEPTQSLQGFALPFLTFMVDLAFGNIYQLATSSHEQKVSFLQMHR